MKSEIRFPEARTKAEISRPKHPPVAGWKKSSGTGNWNRSFRASGFGFLSDLGFRTSDFGLKSPDWGNEFPHSTVAHQTMSWILEDGDRRDACPTVSWLTPCMSPKRLSRPAPSSSCGKNFRAAGRCARKCARRNNRAGPGAGWRAGARCGSCRKMPARC